MITNIMKRQKTISLPPSLEKMLEDMVRQGVAKNKSEVMRKALERLAEQEAIDVVLRAEKEPDISGDLRTLLKEIT